MLKTRLRSVLILSIVVSLCTCIDPYKPNLNGFVSLLVVDGMITNENASYEIKLSGTKRTSDLSAEKISDAVVYITDENNSRTTLINYGGGSYRTDSTTFTGSVGKTYTLHIITSDEREYQSEPSFMSDVADIDSIYYEKEVGYTNNQSELHDGITIYTDSGPGDESNKYYRWSFDETWKFRVPSPQRFIYISKDSILPVFDVKDFCWKEQQSTDILITSVPAGQQNIVKKSPICFITPDKSDRLSIEYSILVKQYSISKKEYNFWNDLKKVNEINGDIFGSQPFPVNSNIFNTHNPDERVVGYFQVSAVKQRRKFISFNELSPLDLPLYHYDCKRITTSPDDYCRGMGYCIPPTWDELNKMWTNSGYTFVEAYYNTEPHSLFKLVFTKPVCANCELTGTLSKPAYWIDLN